MNLRRFINRILRGRGKGSSRVYVMPEQAPGSGSDCATEKTGEPVPPDSGHRERRSYIFRRAYPNELIPDDIESWDRHGNIMEGNTVKTRIVTASDELVPAEELQGICSVCQQADSVLLRSEISQRSLCRHCQRVFTRPDGSEIIVSPDEYTILWQNFDTWSAYDHRRRGGNR